MGASPHRPVVNRMLLSIDTATHQAAIAISDGRGVRGLAEWYSERNHTVELLPNVVRLLAECGAAANDLTALAVAIGPGSYTGLRIGLSVAKGFCFASGAALIGVPTLDISAQAYPAGEGVLCALLQAGRGRLAAAFYRVDGGRWLARGGDFMGRADDLAARCAGQDTFFTGEVDGPTEQTLRERLGACARFAPADERKRDPRVLARLAWARWQRGDVDDVETLAPVYGQ